VEENLANRVYANMGEMIQEVRLIYSNGRAFNATGAAHGDKIAKDICEAAAHMESRLEEKLVSTRYAPLYPFACVTACRAARDRPRHRGAPRAAENAQGHCQI
jgi:hypothetical protein